MTNDKKVGFAGVSAMENFAIAFRKIFSIKDIATKTHKFYGEQNCKIFR